MNLDIKQKHKRWADLSPKEQAYYLKAINDFLTDQITVEEVKSTFSGNTQEIAEELGYRIYNGLTGDGKVWIGVIS